MNMTASQVADVVEIISRLEDPCIFESAWAVSAGTYSMFAMDALLEMTGEGIIKFTDVPSHRHLIFIQSCMVCGWQWGKSNEQHESWYIAHTQAYRHLYVPSALEVVES